MTESAKYFRDSLPGLVTILMYSLFWIVSDYDVALEFVSGGDRVSNLWSGVLAALASLALGYLQAQIYHSYYWSRFMHRGPSVDHFDLLTRVLNNAQTLIVRDQDGDVIKMSELKAKSVRDRHTCWIMGNYLMRFHLTSCGNRTETWIDRLVDYTHSVGSTVAGLYIAFLFWLPLHWYFRFNSGTPVFSVSDLFATLLFLLVLLPLISLYRMNRRAVEETSNSVILASFKDAGLKGNLPIEAFYYRT